MTDSDTVLKAAQRLGRAHREFRHARDESERQFEEIQKNWMQSHAGLLEELCDDDEELYDVFEPAVREYLSTGQADDDVFPRDVLEQLDASRGQFANMVAAVSEATNPAEQALRDPSADFVAALRSWLEWSRTAGGNLADWPEILKAWRSALGMTTREAAAALDVSPSAVVRYEGATRSPSAPYVAAMIERIEAWDSTSEETLLRTAARRLARMFGSDGDGATEILENTARPWDTLVFAVEEALPALTQTQLQVVAALVAAPAALDAIDALVRNNPLQAVLDAVADGHDKAVTVTEAVR